MFDNLRQQSIDAAAEADQSPSSESGGRPFLGLSPAQRFVLALMLFLNVTVLGCFALVAFNKIALPF